MATSRRQHDQQSVDRNHDVLVERHGATVLARLNRPEHRNSIHGALLRDVIETLEAADADDGVRATFTTGEGPTYCVGADKNVFTTLGAAGGIELHALGYQGTLGGDWGMPALSPGPRRADTHGVGRWITRYLDVGTPTIAAINGGAAGGGLALALLHDIRIASTRAKFAPTFISLGVSPEMGLSWLLSRIVGLLRAFDLVTRARPIDPDEALDFGLVETVVEPHELLDAAVARAEQLAQLQEEVYVVLRGTAELEVGGQRSALDADRIARVGPGTSRKLYSGPDGARVLVIGAIPGEVYSRPERFKLGAPDPTIG